MMKVCATSTCQLSVGTLIKKGYRAICLILMVSLFGACKSVHRLADEQVQVELSAEDARRYEYYFLEALRLESQERYDEAFGMLQHCLTICPSAPSALFKMANYYFFLGQKDKALSALEQAVASDADNFWYRKTLASYFQTNREYEKAIAEYERMEERFPKKRGEILPLLVGLYNHTQQYDKVIASLTKLETLVGKTEGISMEKSRNYILMGNSEGAFQEMEALAGEYPENAYYRIILAEVYIDHGRKEEALPILQKVLHEEPDNGPAKIVMAEYYRAVSDTVGYLAMTDSVLMSDNVDDDTKVKMLLQLISEKADSVYLNQIIDKAMSRPQRTARLGHLCVQYLLANHQGEERVRPVLLRMLEAEPDNVQARLQLLSYAAQRDNIDELIDICSTAIDYNPEVIEFYYYKGVGLYQKDQPEEALKTFKKATEQVTEDTSTDLISDLFASMGDLYHEQGNFSEAYLCYDSALVYNPSNLSTLNNYAYFLSEEGIELGKAEKMSKRTIEEEPDNATYLDTYAWILYKMGRCSEAAVYIKRAIENDPTQSEVLLEHADKIRQCVK